MTRRPRLAEATRSRSATSGHRTLGNANGEATSSWARATVVWMLEEVGVPYTLKFVDVRANEQKSPALLAMNPMGKLPVLEDDGVVVTEVAAIGLYLADRYALGRLAPQPDASARGTHTSAGRSSRPRWSSPRRWPTSRSGK